MNRSPPGSSVHGILEARVLEWVAISSFRGSSQSRDQTQVSCIAGKFIPTEPFFFFFFSGEVIKFLDIYPSPFTEQALHYNPGIVPSVQFPSQEMCRLMQWDMTGLAFVLPRPRMPFSRFCMTCDPRTISISLGFPTGSKCGRTIWCQLLPTASEMAKSTSTTCRRAEVSTSCLACLLRHDTGI